MNTDIGSQRLLILAEFLPKVSKQSFDITGWVTYRNLNEEQREDLRQTAVNMEEDKFWEQLPDCNFAGCAVGWATRIPEFKEAGFSISAYPLYEGRQNWEAVMEFFGISNSEARYLFAGSEYSTYPVEPAMVSKRIKEFLEDIREEPSVF